MRQRLKLLEETLHKEVPLTRQMGVRAEEHDGRELVIKADFEPNINIHGTAFGGSSTAFAPLPAGACCI